MRKFVIRDPNVTVNQTAGTEGNSNSSALLRGEGYARDFTPGATGQSLADSYARRQMFYYGAEEQQQ